MIKQSRHLIKRGRISEASQMLRKHLGQHPDDLDAWHAMRDAAQLLGDEDLLEHCQRAIAYLSEGNTISARQAARRYLQKPGQVLTAVGSGFIMVGLLGLILVALPNQTLEPASAEITTTSAPTITETPSIEPSNTAVPTPTASATVELPTPIPDYAPIPVDYSDLQADLEDLHRRTAERGGWDLGIAFVDIKTGQVVSVNGDERYHAMSSFKGPLIAYYYWLIEQGQLEPGEDDERYIARMLRISDNETTACIFKRVNGVARFNDWLAIEQKMDRENNFVLDWDDWSCYENGELYTPAIDWRYSNGDDLLGLPAKDLLKCGPAELPCDKAFTPVDLAQFYARLYQGKVIEVGDAAIMLSFMRHAGYGSTFIHDMPEDDPSIAIYSKGGSQQATEEYRVNFFVDAGIIETDKGAFSMAVMMQRNPRYPGTGPFSEAARIAYDHFIENHD